MTIGDGRVAGVIAAVGKLFAAALDLLTFVGVAVVLTRVRNSRRTTVHADREYWHVSARHAGVIEKPISR